MNDKCTNSICLAKVDCIRNIKCSEKEPFLLNFSFFVVLSNFKSKRKKSNCIENSLTILQT